MTPPSNVSRNAITGAYTTLPQETNTSTYLYHPLPFFKHFFTGTSTLRVFVPLRITGGFARVVCEYRSLGVLLCFCWLCWLCCFRPFQTFCKSTACLLRSSNCSWGPRQPTPKRQPTANLSASSQAQASAASKKRSVEDPISLTTKWMHGQRVTTSKEKPFEHASRSVKSDSSKKCERKKVLEEEKNNTRGKL